jgi:exosortase
MRLRRWHRRIFAPEWLCLALLLLQFHRALLWIAGTWTDDTYQSVGLFALVALVFLQRRPPPRRDRPSSSHLIGLALVSLLDLLCTPLSVNVLSASLAVLAFHLWAVSFRQYHGRWFLHPQLLLGLLCLPAVYWVNILFGHQLQQLAGRIAAAGLALYGVPARVEGTLIHVGSTVIGVDAACSGVKLLVAGALFGLLAQPVTHLWRRLLFWIGLAVALLSANVARVLSLILAHLHLGRAPSEAVHQAIGLVAFLIACSGALLLSRWLARVRIVPDLSPPAEASA